MNIDDTPIVSRSHSRDPTHPSQLKTHKQNRDGQEIVAEWGTANTMGDETD